MQNGNEMNKLVELYKDFCKLYEKLFRTSHQDIVKLKGCFIVFFSYEKNDNEYLTLGKCDLEAIKEELKEIEKDYKNKGWI